ncbi:ATP-binding protein [Cupriavidus basilensis]|uniref:ATP-binding protein n=1 Tax=Cupriavidus basilensis TaxID=68895 RepID=UPI0023E824DC|nr:ATP-binding protein [Cupriavidus basilensis]MDF3881435.1 ATP-binding protein [Cupriavidus basilensis]
MNSLRGSSQFTLQPFSLLYCALKCASFAAQYALFFVIALLLRDPSARALALIAALGSVRIVLGWVLARLVARSVTMASDRLHQAAKLRKLGNADYAKSLYRFLQQRLDFTLAREDLAGNLLGIAVALLAIGFWISLQALGVLIGVVLICGLVFVLQWLSVYALTRINETVENRNTEFNELLGKRLGVLGLEDMKRTSAARLDALSGQERLWRALDSGMKISETYLGILLKILPIAAIGAIGIIPGMSISEASVAVFWVSMPLFTALLAIPREVQAWKAIKSAQAHIDAACSPLPLGPSSFVTFNGKDTIWSASLGVNLLGRGPLRCRLLHKLGMWEELGLEVRPKPFEKLLAPDRLSEGQKQRLLLIRAVCCAVDRNVPLRLSTQLTSLDLPNRMKVKAILEQFSTEGVLKVYGADGISHEGYLEPSERESYVAPIRREVPSPGRSDNAPAIPSFVRWYFPVFIVAAYLDANVARLIDSHGSLPREAIWSAMGAFVLAIVGGMALEDHVRRRTFRSLSLAIFRSSSANTEIERSVPVDLDIAQEGFSYYLHDFMWALAVFTLFSVSLVFSAGVLGIGCIAGFGALVWFFYTKNYRGIVLAREQMLEASRTFVITIRDWASFDLATASLGQTTRTRRMRAALALPSLQRWTHAKIRLYLKKVKLALLLEATFHVLLVLCLSFMLLAKGDASLAAFLLSALLAADRESLRLFVAGSGLLTTASSFQAISKLPQGNRIPWVHFEKDEEGIRLAEARSVLTGIRYPEVSFNFGVNWVLGRSGCGKTTLLTELFWALHRWGHTVAFFGRREMQEICQGRRADAVLREILENHQWRSGGTLILDEALEEIREDELESIYQYLDVWGRDRRVVILNTDHRTSAQTPGYKYVLQG